MVAIVRDLIQWSLRFLRDSQALNSTLASIGMLLGPSGLLKHVETLDSVSIIYCTWYQDFPNQNCSKLMAVASYRHRNFKRSITDTTQSFSLHLPRVRAS